ncbi:hypothetical protein [Gordonia phthalatica]|uniref:hypothetical protein n=1 Tax=Gordonia phthalatica TaxID=1136941 RepID=UPI000A60AA91|nr:hypothetical protein [Gordonia phthalatica]
MPYLFVVLIVFAAAYLAWRITRTQPHQHAGPSRGQQPPAPRGPDDDPDFLRSLDDR